LGVIRSPKERIKEYRVQERQGSTQGASCQGLLLDGDPGLKWRICFISVMTLTGNITTGTEVIQEAQTHEGILRITGGKHTAPRRAERGRKYSKNSWNINLLEKGTSQVSLHQTTGLLMGGIRTSGKEISNEFSVKGGEHRY